MANLIRDESVCNMCILTPGGSFSISNFKRLFPQKNDILLLRYMFTVLYLDIGRRFIYFENSRIRPKMPGIVWNHPQK